MYYFLEDVFPRQEGGFRILETPRFLKWAFDPPPLPYVDIHERPGGFNWGVGEENQQPEEDGDGGHDDNNNNDGGEGGGGPRE